LNIVEKMKKEMKKSGEEAGETLLTLE